MAFFDVDGKKVEGRLASVGKGVRLDEIMQSVAAAVGRCQNKVYKGSALKEMQALFMKYPQLKKDAWAVGDHPCSQLVELYARELFG